MRVVSVGRKLLDDRAELPLGVAASAPGGSRRCRAPRGSTPSWARAASPSRAEPSPAPSGPSGAASGLRGRSRRHRFHSSQVREVLAHDVGGRRQVARAPDLDSRDRGAVVGCALEHVLELVRRVARQRFEVVVDPRAERPDRCPFVARPARSRRRRPPRARRSARSLPARRRCRRRRPGTAAVPAHATPHRRSPDRAVAARTSIGYGSGSTSSSTCSAR